MNQPRAGNRPASADTQQPDHGLRVVEGDLGGGSIGQRGDLLTSTHLPQPAQQPDHGLRVVSGYGRDLR